LSALFTACSEPSGSSSAVAVEVQPAKVEVVAGGEQTFAALVRNTKNTDVLWSASGGVVAAEGDSVVWTAPTQAGSYTITATSVADPAQKATATAVVVEPEGLSTVYFAAYRGTAATLPQGLFVGGEDGKGAQVGPDYNPFTGMSDLQGKPVGSFDGFGAFTSGGKSYSFGIHERGAVDLREARLFLRYPNTSGKHIVGFDVRFDVEVWQLGERANRIRFKFNTDVGGFGEIPDLLSVENPRGRVTGSLVGTLVDGSRTENRVRASTRVLLADVPRPDGGAIGSLAPGDTGYFRWQYSNADGDDGKLRSALALNNIVIVPIYSETAPPPSGPALTFSHAAGFYTEPVKLTLSSGLPGATIYYTVDGSTPDPARVMDDAAWAARPVETRARTFVYTQPIDLAHLGERADEITLIPTGGTLDYWAWRKPLANSYKGTVVRALAVGGSKTSALTTNTYFIAPQGRGRYTLPVVSLSTDRRNFFAPDIGIYVPGASGTNFDERGDEWERPVHVELFDLQGKRALAQGAGARMHGGFTRQAPQKALRITARDEYGANRFAYRFFTSKSQGEFKSIVLRASGQDVGVAHLRDAAMQTLVQHLPVETQHYQPFILFINGEYWGLHEFRDRFDDQHLAIRYGLDRENLTLLEDDGVVVDGDPAGEAEYRGLLERVRTGTLNTREAVNAEMDLDGYLDYVITEMYAANTDWPDSNIKFWRYRGAKKNGNPFSDGRWRWLLFDVDWTFGHIGQKDTNMVDFLLVSGEKLWARELFRGLLKIPAVRQEFLQRTAVHLATTFHPDRVRPHIDSMAQVIKPEMEEQIRRWTRPASLSEWQKNVDKMRDFADGRPAFFRQHVDAHFAEVTGTAALQITGIGGNQGLTLHTLPLAPQTPGVRISGGSWTGDLFTGIPVVLKATGADLTEAVVTGGATDIKRAAGELSFVMTGPAQVALP
jgi:hypothetical protein